MQDINLGFLWEERKMFVLDAPDPFWEKWQDEKYKYSKFIKERSLQEIIALKLISFKDKYPRDYWYGILSVGRESSTNIYKEGVYEVVDGKYIVRGDIVKQKWIPKLHKQEFEFDSERIYEFKDPISLTAVVEENLSDKTYTKTETQEETIYKVKNSPIAEIGISPLHFRMTINEDYYVYRGW